MFVYVHFVIVYLTIFFMWNEIFVRKVLKLIKARYVESCKHCPYNMDVYLAGNDCYGVKSS